MQTHRDASKIQKQMPRIKSVIYGLSVPFDPLVTVVPSILEKVLNFIPPYIRSGIFSMLNLLDIDHGTLKPSYFNDFHALIHLAFLLHP